MGIASPGLHCSPLTITPLAISSFVLNTSIAGGWALAPRAPWTPPVSLVRGWRAKSVFAHSHFFFRSYLKLEGVLHRAATGESVSLLQVFVCVIVEKPRSPCTLFSLLGTLMGVAYVEFYATADAFWASEFGLRVVTHPASFSETSTARSRTWPPLLPVAPATVLGSRCWYRTRRVDRTEYLVKKTSF